jgi:hypothetical protein
VVPPPPPLDGFIVSPYVLVSVVQESSIVKVTVYVPAEPVEGVPEMLLPEHVSPVELMEEQSALQE